MLKEVILKIQEGNCENGFSILLDIFEEGRMPHRYEGRLPPAPNIQKTLKDWQENYRTLNSDDSRGIEIKKAQITNISYQESGNKLTEELNNWLDSTLCLEWKKLQNILRTKLNEEDEVHVIIQTSDTTLRQIPWQLWSLFHDYKNSEFALSPLEYERKSINVNKKNNLIKILVILGDDTGISFDEDIRNLEQLPGVRVTFLKKANSEKIRDTLWEQPHDVLFFLGHSSSQDNASTGQIAINATENISIKILKEALQHAVTLGLKLAIFNSCDGLGLAEELTSVIPHVVVMREAIRNIAAQKFLEFFLRDFSRGNLLPRSIRYARDRLQDLDNNNEIAFKFSSWLPTIYHNPAEEVLTWEYLRYGKKPLYPKLGKIKLIQILALFLIIPSLYLIFFVNNRSKYNELRFTKESGFKKEKLNLDINKYCKNKYSSDFNTPDHKDIHTIYDWECINEKTGERHSLEPKNFLEICKKQHGINWVSYIDETEGFSLYCNKDKTEKF